jgi:CRP/FNR family transcriptional regulator
MAVTVEKIRSFPILLGLEEKTLRELASAMIEKPVQAGSIVTLQGEEARLVYIVARGIIRARRLSPEGKELILYYIGPGRIVDITSAVNGNHYTVTTDALTNATLYALPSEEFRQIVTNDKLLALNLLNELANIARRLTIMVEEMALHTVRTRLARFLIQQSELRGQNKQWTQAEIASQIGTVREIVGRILREFASQGLVTRQGGQIVILNRDKLLEIAQMEEDSYGGNGSH